MRMRQVAAVLLACAACELARAADELVVVKARTTAECWQMVRACEKNGVKLMVGHKRRLRPPWARPRPCPPTPSLIEYPTQERRPPLHTAFS